VRDCDDIDGPVSASVAPLWVYIVCMLLLWY